MSTRKTITNLNLNSMKSMAAHPIIEISKYWNFHYRMTLICVFLSKNIFFIELSIIIFRHKRYKMKIRFIRRLT
jgi:hypothetical protein